MIDSDRLWRFTVVLVPKVGVHRFGWSNPVVVRSGKEIVGFASLFLDGNSVKADVGVKYELPERLDAETGKVYLLPFAEVLLLEEPVFVHIKELHFRNDCIDPSIEPVGSAVL